MSSQAYREAVLAILEVVARDEASKIEIAAQWCVDSIGQGGVVYAFGTGHSHMLAEEMFFRAGGLVPVIPILDTDLMIHVDAPKSSRMERLTGLAEVLLLGESTKPGDVMFIFSNSGRNAVPIEMAVAARERGMRVIGLTSMAHSMAVTSRAPGNRKLFEEVDLVIDNHGVPGDAVVPIPGSPIKVAATSTLVGTFIVQSIVAEVATRLAQQGHQPPITMSGNLDGAGQYNQRILAEYNHRVGESRIRR